MAGRSAAKGDLKSFHSKIPPNYTFTSEEHLLIKSLRVSLQTFIAKWNGRGCNPDNNPYGFQCVEVPNEWARENGIEIFGGNADQFPNDAHPNCTWIANTPANVPSPGDIVVWGAMPGNPLVTNHFDLKF
jgi:hypothetical protein